MVDMEAALWRPSFLHRSVEQTTQLKLREVLMGWSRRGFVGGASAFALMVGSASAQKRYDDGASDTEIKIGNTNPHSGPASSYAAIGNTIETYFKSLNEKGGINGRKVKFISLDD